MKQKHPEEYKSKKQMKQNKTKYLKFEKTEKEKTLYHRVQETTQKNRQINEFPKKKTNEKQ